MIVVESGTGRSGRMGSRRCERSEELGGRGQGD